VGDQDWRALAQPILGNGEQVEGWVQAVRSLRPVDDALAALATELYIILPLAVVLAAVASYFVAGRALRPLTRMAHTAHQIGPATLDRRIRYHGPADEVGQTAMAFDGMLDRVEQGFQRERRFSADASHELRTPLAGIKTAIAVTLGRGRSAQEHEEVLHDVDRRVDQLIRLCDDLLLLARGGRPRSGEAETVDLNALLEVSVEELQPSAEEAGVSIQAYLPPRLTVPGFADDLIRLFLNLLSNAIRHTPSGESVTLTARLEAGVITVLLSDDGPGIAPEHLEHLFEPFYQADPSRSGGDRGVGLGLAIAQEIAHAHGGDIEVHSLLGRGTTFEVRLPGVAAIS
jgi:heavy metal sensor kinase